MAMLDMQDHERDYIEKEVSRKASAYINEIGKASLSDMTKDEWRGLLITIVTNGKKGHLSDE